MDQEPSVLEAVQTQNKETATAPKTLQISGRN